MSYRFVALSLTTRFIDATSLLLDSRSSTRTRKRKTTRNNVAKIEAISVDDDVVDECMLAILHRHRHIENVVNEKGNSRRFKGIIWCGDRVGLAMNWHPLRPYVRAIHQQQAILVSMQ